MNILGKYIIFFFLFCSCLVNGVYGQVQSSGNFIHLEKSFRFNSKIEKDDSGTMWIGDLDGIYQYNGYEFLFTPFKEIFGEDFINRRAVTIHMDSRENLWISLMNGNLAYIDSLGNFNRVENNSSRIFNAVASREDEVWFGSLDGSIFRFSPDRKLNVFASLPVYKGKIQGVSQIVFGEGEAWISTNSENIYRYGLENKKLVELELPFEKKEFDQFHITTDNRGNLWLATENEGLWRLDISNNKFEKIPIYADHSHTDKNVLFRCIYMGSDGNIWAGSDGEGLYQIDSKTLHYKEFKKDRSNPFSLTENTIRDIEEDSNGNLWILAKDGIINILPHNKNEISYYPGSGSGYPTTVLSILKSGDNDLYIGTDGNGLTRVKTDGTSEKIGILPVDFVQSMVEDQNGKIWIGSYLNGLHIYDPEKNTSKKIETTLKDVLDVRKLFVDSKKRIWVGSTGGIRIFDQDQQLLAQFNFDTHGLSGNQIGAINETADGNIWLAGTGGLFQFEEAGVLKESSFTRRKYYKDETEGMYDYLISEIQISGHFLWLRVDSGFLIKYDPEDYSFESLQSRPLLGDIEIESFLFENENSVWLSSRSGIHNYDFKQNTLNSYYRSDGMQGNTYVRRASYKADDGKLYFGGSYGVSSFFPQNLQKSYSEPKLFLNQIEVLNNKASTIIPEQVSLNANTVEQLDLKANQSSFSFGFFAIENLLKPDFNYRYHLKGFDKGWIDAGKERRAVYTNIPPGKYTFQVEAIPRNSKLKPLVRNIDISISPYWWESNLAYAIYILAFFLLLYGYYAWNRMRNMLIQEEWQHGKEREVYATKMNFFAKMSHEIQTPLTLILAPLGDMIQKASAKDSLLHQRLNSIQRNAEKLSRIATDLTTIRNKTLNKLKLYVSKNDLREDLRKIAIGFNELANLKNINFEVLLPEEPIRLWYDPAKLEHVFYNLLSNAFKFTPVGGKISLKIEKKKGGFSVSVIDNGPGISKEEQASIFQIFYQSEEGREVQGMGIGLALSKELVDMHDGGIEVFSEVEKGTHFQVFLRKGKSHFKNREEVVFVNTKVGKEKNIKLDIAYEKWKPLKENTKEATNKPSILIVEDNIEMQVFLKDLLSDYYNIQTADNGKLAFEKLEEKIPDLIISDVMMPEMDGVEMSKKILKNKRYNHIPIVLLTAKADNASRLIGLRTGAISYIQKPFNPSEIFVQIDNLLTRNENIISRFQIRNSTQAEVNAANNKDTLFIKELSATLNENVGDPNFRLEDLSRKMSMSYSVIFRKCQELTGKTLTEYFRLIKIKKAAALIVKNNYRVSDAAFQIGYSDSKYFSKCFKEVFRKSPSQFKKDVDENNLEETLAKF